MFSATTLRDMQPGYLLNRYPERVEATPHALQAHMRTGAVRWRARQMQHQFKRISRQLSTTATSAMALNEHRYQRRLAAIQVALREEGWTRSNLIEALGLVGAQVRSVYGFELHPEQYFGSWVMLHGMLAEMATGEGKTLVAGVCAVVAGLSGIPAHVITSNDYLVSRDASNLRPLFDAFNLTSAFVDQDSDDDQRRQAYGSDVCYVTNKQLVFDYLRDRQSCGARPSSIAARVGALNGGDATAPLLRGLCFGIVDEADSAFIDDAITPLILSQQMTGEDGVADSITALSLASRLQDEHHYTLNTQAQQVTLTPDGLEHLTLIADGLRGKWTNSRYRVELVRQALSALYIYKRDVDYLVRDGEVVLIDQATGRLMPDRKLQHGLHQIIETKEKCELSGATRTIASLSFQSFFVRYKHLCGMTGTASEAASELSKTYGLGVVPIPTHKPTVREDQGAYFAVSETHYRELLVESVRSRIKCGQPVLIGTRSLAHSELIGEFLTEAGITHQLLNARQDADESRVVSRAGRPSVVTIATNMAGRGTDIPISNAVRMAGGLHVIVSQFNESRRVDRQLIGRCSRQGDPGSYEFIIAHDDPMLSKARKNSSKEAVSTRPEKAQSGSRALFKRARRAQAKLETKQRVMREQVAMSDEHMRKKLSYTGYKE
ncbi:MAG: hypothetical protein AB8G18_08190 [Gammaproteobacteria bacterium]